MESSLMRYVREFVTNDEDTFNGVVPTICMISDREINGFIELYRSIDTSEKRTNEELRPFAIKSIILFRNWDE